MANVDFNILLRYPGQMHYVNWGLFYIDVGVFGLNQQNLHTIYDKTDQDIHIERLKR